MNGSPIPVLLIESNASDADLVRKALARGQGRTFQVECLTRLDNSLERLGSKKFDVILLDLNLPDAQG